MFRLIKDIIFGFRFKRAVKKADSLHHVTHRKYMVLVINRKLEVLSKRELKTFIAHGIFRRGTRLREAGLKVVDIHDLAAKATSIIGTPDALPFGDKVVGIVMDRHGKVLDKIYNIQ